MKTKLRELAARLMLSLPAFEWVVRYCCRRPLLNRLLRTGGIVTAIPDVAKGPIDRVACLDGFRLCVDICNRASAQQYFYGITEVPPLLDRCVRPGDTCLDIGANFGVFTCDLARRVGPSGRVVAYEPNPRMVEYLRRSILINGFETIVEVHDTALCEKSTSKRRFHIDNNNANTGLSSLLTPEERGLGRNGESLQVIETPASTLSDELLLRGVGSVSFAKIDVEGAGPLVLEGGKESLIAGGIKHILIEVRDIHSSFDQLLSYGFTCEWVEGSITTIARRADERRFGDLFATYKGHAPSDASNMKVALYQSRNDAE